MPRRRSLRSDRGVTPISRSIAGAIAVVACLAAAAGCDDGEASLGPGAGVRDPESLAQSLRTYVTDAKVRRDALETSLVNRDNAYARLRLDRYGDDRAWGLLEELDPETTPIRVDDVASGAPSSDATWTSFANDTKSDEGFTARELKALGERAFYNYPVQLVPTLPNALSSPNRAGMWDHDGRTGAVWVRFSSGSITSAFTCSTCHASVDHGALITGRNNADLDVGRINGDGLHGPAWGLGRVDVTADGIDNPVTITDLRPLRFQENLHHAATLRNDPIALAVRIETLIITSHHEAVRPPRKIIAALALFLLDLAPKSALPSPESPGAAVFERTCASCHRGEGRTGPAVPFSVVGTDPMTAESPDRGTGMYRVPSLRAVGDRRRLFASGEVEDIVDLVTPSPGREAKGHVYGLELGDADRAALLDYLRQL